MPHGATLEALGTVRRQRVQGEDTGRRVYCGFRGKDQRRLGLANFGLASLKIFRRLWGIGAAPRCVALGPGVMRMGEYWSGA